LFEQFSDSLRHLIRYGEKSVEITEKVVFWLKVLTLVLGLSFGWTLLVVVLKVVFGGKK
jgi:hypothetical protein